ncbi:MAG TPA: alanine dehydrogenase [Burkholderiales bacterium]|nr:alanine dehydrogenase [Burkholderiales bacterium]
MLIGVPKEIKDHEYRVGLIPAGAHALVKAGHRVQVEADAGTRVGFDDQEYRRAGATLVRTPQEVYAADLIIKVKELQPREYALTHPGQILFGYHHFAPDRELLQAMLDAKVTAVAYETVTDATGALPLLLPMSQIAGRLAPQMAAWALQMAHGGSGLLLSGVPGVMPAKVVVIGGGTVGQGAARIAMGMGADVTLLDRNAARLTHLDDIFGPRLKTSLSTEANLPPLVHDADVLIGAVLLPGKRAPHLVTREDLRHMRRGSVIVDVAIDQGGICETSRPTTHSAPTYIEEGIVHYCVANMPAAVARTATLALTQVTLPCALEIANKGLAAAIGESVHVRNGLQTYQGLVTHAGLAQDTGRPYADPLAALG